MVLGRATFDVPMGRQAGAARGGRTCAVIVYNPEDVTHMFRTRTISRTARTHAPSHGRVTRAPHELRTHARTLRDALHCTLFFAHALFCVACLCDRASLALVSSTLTQFNSAYEHSRNEQLRIRSLRPIVPVSPYGRMCTRNRIPLALSLLRLPQKQPQVNQHKRNTIQKSNI